MFKSRTTLGLTSLETREVPAIDLVGQTLYISGSSNADTVTVEYQNVDNQPGQSQLYVRRTETGRSGGVVVEEKYLPANSVNFVIANLFDGNDVLDARKNLFSGMIVNGGNGDDILIGGQSGDNLNGQIGNDVLVGNDGNDNLDGGEGKDILIGGWGGDVLTGGGDRDVMIAGYTLHDNNISALRALRNEWAREGQLINPVTSLMNGSGLANGYKLNATTVFDDHTPDTLNGGGGQDWFLVDIDGPSSYRDVIDDKATNEQVLDIDYSYFA